MKHFLQIITVISVLTASTLGSPLPQPDSTDIGISQPPWDSLIPKLHPKERVEPKTNFFSKIPYFLNRSLYKLERSLRMPIRYLRSLFRRKEQNNQSGNYPTFKHLLSLAAFLTIIILLFLLLYIFVLKSRSKSSQEDENLSDPCLKKDPNKLFFDCLETFSFEDNLSVEEDEEERKKAEAITQYLLDARKNGELYRQETDRVSVALAFPDDKRPFSSETPSPLSEGRYQQVEKKNSGGSWDPEGREARGDQTTGEIRARVSSLNLPKKLQ